MNWRRFFNKIRRPRVRKIRVQLPFGLVSAELELDDTQQRAAWELYVELATRIAVQPLDSEGGLLREALDSLHALFGVTRDVLRRAGPTVGASENSIGGVAIAALNRGLRPFLTKWHPQLADWEARHGSEVSKMVHEQRWERAAELREELNRLRGELGVYAKALASGAGVRTADQ